MYFQWIISILVLSENKLFGQCVLAFQVSIIVQRTDTISLRSNREYRICEIDTFIGLWNSSPCVYYNNFDKINDAIKGIVHLKMKISWTCAHPQVIQKVDEYISSSEQVWRNLALHHLVTNGSSSVNGCRQNESLNNWYKYHNNPQVIHTTPVHQLMLHVCKTHIHH